MIASLYTATIPFYTNPVVVVFCCFPMVFLQFTQFVCLFFPLSNTVRKRRSQFFTVCIFLFLSYLNVNIPVFPFNDSLIVDAYELYAISMSLRRSLLDSIEIRMVHRIQRIRWAISICRFLISSCFLFTLKLQFFGKWSLFFTCFCWVFLFCFLVKKPCTHSHRQIDIPCNFSLLHWGHKRDFGTYRKKNKRETKTKWKMHAFWTTEIIQCLLYLFI